MGALRIAILAVAAIAAIAVALLVRGMMGPRQAAEPAVAEAATPMARVLVAQRDLAVGTMLAAADMGWQPWPVDAVNDTMITDGAQPAPPAKGAAKVAEAAGALVAGPGKIEALEGAVVKDAILKGEPIVGRKIVRGGEGGFMSVLLQPGMQAIGVPISNETTAGGFILPGDRVDVLQGRDAGGDRGYVTETLLRNVRVLAIDQATEPGKDAKTIVGSVATLEVPTRDVPVIVRAKAQGQMVLALRAYSDIGGAVGRGGLGENTTVRIFRAGEATEVAVR